MATITSAEALAPPTWRFLLAHPAHFVALVGGIGLIRYAPGTFGTLVALPLHWWLANRVDPYVYLFLIVALFAVGVWASGRTVRDLGVPDHGGIVIDETVAFLAVLYFTPYDRVWEAFAFLLFRLFDIFKPQPIRHFDRNLHGGIGVMFDDLLAAGYTLLCLAAFKAITD